MKHFQHPRSVVRTLATTLLAGLVALAACKNEPGAASATALSTQPAKPVTPTVVPPAIPTPPPGPTVTFGGAAVTDPAATAAAAATVLNAAAQKGRKTFCPDLTVGGIPAQITQGQSLDLTLKNLLADGAWVSVSAVASPLGSHLVRSTASTPVVAPVGGDDDDATAAGSGVAPASGSGGAAAAITQLIKLPLGVIEPGDYEVRVFCTAGLDLAFVQALKILPSPTPIIVPGANEGGNSPFLSASDPDVCPEATLGINKADALNAENLSVSVGGIPPGYSHFVQIGAAGAATYSTYVHIFTGTLPVTATADALVSLPLDAVDKTGDYVVSLFCSGNAKPKLPVPVKVTVSDLCKDATINLPKTTWANTELLSVTVNGVSDRGGRLEVRSAGGGNLVQKTIAGLASPSGDKLPPQTLSLDVKNATGADPAYEIRLFCGSQPKPSVTRAVHINYVDPCLAASVSPVGSNFQTTDKIDINITNIPTTGVSLALVQGITERTVASVSTFTGDAAGETYATATGTMPLYGVDESGTYELRLSCASGRVSKTQPLVVQAVDPCAATTVATNKAVYQSTETMTLTLGNAPLFYPSMRLVLKPTDVRATTIESNINVTGSQIGTGPVTKAISLAEIPVDKTLTYDVRLKCLKEALHGGDSVSIAGLETIVRTSCGDSMVALSASTTPKTGTLTVNVTGTAPLPVSGRVMVSGDFQNRSAYKTYKYLSQGTTIVGGKALAFPLTGFEAGSYVVKYFCDGGGELGAILPFSVTN